MRTLDYRHDIDGLRAIAVLLVTIFHINESLIPGGFVGVDVFFVISGFLITGIIVRDVKEGRFSFGEFYRRRFRRILPAMFAVTFITLLVGILIMLPEDAEQLAWSAIATSLSGANIFFTYFLDTSYFAADSSTVPLLHMWSLGVEEQFYIIWPLLILMLIKSRASVIVLCLVVITSISISEWQLRSSQFEWAYYMLPSRAFQLAIGGLLVFLPVVPKSLAFMLMPLGLGAIIGSAWLLDASSAFPGVNALPVTLGTAALLAGGAHNTVWARGLSVAPLRWIGLISYSLYLWHWPVLAFQRYLIGELPPVNQFASFLAMLALATASYYLIEQPFRRSSASIGSVFRKTLLVPLTACVSVAATVTLSGGFGVWSFTSYPERLERLQSARPSVVDETVCVASSINVELFSRDSCLTGDVLSNVKTVLYGDSNASHYVGFISVLAEQAGVSVRNIAHSSCPPIISDTGPFVRPEVAAACAVSRSRLPALVDSYDTHIIAASWPTYEGFGRRAGANFRREVDRTISYLANQGKRIVLIGKAPHATGFDAACDLKALKVFWLNCDSASSFSAVSPSINAWLASLAQRFPNVLFIDPWEEICSAEGCYAYRGGEPIYADPGHLSTSGSRAIGKTFSGSDAGRALQRFLNDV